MLFPFYCFEVLGSCALMPSNWSQLNTVFIELFVLYAKYPYDRVHHVDRYSLFAILHSRYVGAAKPQFFSAQALRPSSLFP